MGVVVDKETDNEGKDIYVSFETPDDKEKIKIIEERFSKLYRQPMTIDNITLDLVIMSKYDI